MHRFIMALALLATMIGTGLCAAMMDSSTSVASSPGGRDHPSTGFDGASSVKANLTGFASSEQPLPTTGKNQTAFDKVRKYTRMAIGNAKSKLRAVLDFIRLVASLAWHQVRQIGSNIAGNQWARKIVHSASEKIKSLRQYVKSVYAH